MNRISLLFENDYCMVLDKPAGLAVQGGEGVGASLDSILNESFKTRPLLVHRLDRDTSGVILVAKNREAAALFSGIFREKLSGFNKQYIAVTAGIPDPPSGIIRLDLEIQGKNRKSETSYRLSASGRISATEFSLVELELGTGRMHQIRRHLMLINHPVLGDDKYGDFALNRELRKTFGLRRLLLHACRLVIPPLQPVLPEGLDAKAPAPDYFSPFLDLLDKK
ncbi:MAG: RNA pseudouridine synthase [Treponema sp.]|nr:RNA pseudouridine synthase [Treponema sp.]